MTVEQAIQHKLAEALRKLLKISHRIPGKQP